MSEYFEKDPELPLFAKRKKAEAIRRVDEHADPVWKVRAMSAVGRCARAFDSFTTDDVWRMLGEDGTHEPRAMGAIMQSASRQGLIRKTNSTRPSVRAACHGRDVRVWESLVR